jgi:alkenylglycerophosphocholine/alkenylglycerophosphoethanolamine hydrolase
MIMNSSLLLIALGLAALDWTAISINNRRLRLFSKPMVMLAILGWLWSIDGLTSQMLWFAAGILFSLIGDILLVLPKEQFMGGLIAFLFAHIAYIIGLNPTLPSISFASLIIIAIVALAARGFYQRIAQALTLKGNEKLKLPVLVYTSVISTMLISALMTLIRPDTDWSVASALLVSAGALLFFISDALLAWNKFVERISRADLKVIIAYHLGQVGIVLGAALQFLK